MCLPPGSKYRTACPPGAEFAILHLYVLEQSDRWVNFVAWLAVLGVVLGASLIARQLGAGRTAQLGASVFAATLPMGLVQASSTMNDAVVALWVVVAASEALQLADDIRRWDAAACLAVAAALAAFTKPTAYPCVLSSGSGGGRHLGCPTSMAAQPGLRRLSHCAHAYRECRPLSRA